MKEQRDPEEFLRTYDELVKLKEGIMPLRLQLARTVRGSETYRKIEDIITTNTRRMEALTKKMASYISREEYRPLRP